ncbi:5'-nucleotidase [Tieghemostelium lacteum]|uniref:5'-nucleotidase n=1 Tax=Tieghemostelium lacteum TaxID=361077 RepID=A0A151Z744_TIELA|nr:5'-nucleotidase [Tieghemostelium lacteum]|eukprot:KYQ89783.1 5'-nucleotidase [Tieghemostelium lacteum]
MSNNNSNDNSPSIPSGTIKQHLQTGLRSSSQGLLMEKRRLEEGQSDQKSKIEHLAEGKKSPTKLFPSDSQYSLNDLSNPPTDEELRNYKDLPSALLPPIHKRELSKRVFVNRDLKLDKIEFFGFDMDYTLAVYNSPDFEELAYNMVIDSLITIGYPKSIKKLKYDHSFPIRGLFLDKELGNLLKIDNFGNIILCYHGKQPISAKRTQELYPSMRVYGDDIAKRFYLLNTLFTLPEACLYSDLVEHLERESTLRLTEELADEQQQENSPPLSNITASNNTGVPTLPKGTPTLSSVQEPDGDLSYSNLFQDVRTAMDLVHNDGSLKSKVLDDMPRYIRKTPDMPVFFDKLRQNNNKVFLLTNSEFYYTNKVMSYMMDGFNPKYPTWRDYFNIIIVGADKPRFFSEGTTIREVDINTGNLKITNVKDRFEEGKVYHGGSLPLFQKLTGAKGNRVLYFGDHIFADIIKSKKIHGWRNLLIVPELSHELKVISEQKSTINHLLNLEFIRAEIYRGLDLECTTPPDITVLHNHIKEASDKLNKAYNKNFGSLFKTGSNPTFFAMQVQRYADLYTSDYLNILNYPLFYHFCANSPLMPHESLHMGFDKMSN